MLRRLTFALAWLLAAAPALAFDLDALSNSSSFELQRGVGRVNGRPYDVGVMSGFQGPEALTNDLKQRFAGKATVNMAPAAYGTVVMIADIQSAQCPTCRKPTLANLDTIQRETLVISFVNLPGAPTLGIASAVGSLLTPPPSPSRLQYEGTALRALESDMEVLAQSTFTFGRGWAGTSLVELAVRPSQALASLGSALVTAGYRRMGSDYLDEHPVGGAISSSRTELWTNGDRTIGLEWTPDETARSTKVVVNETHIK